MFRFVIRAGKLDHNDLLPSPAIDASHPSTIRSGMALRASKGAWLS
jgi:hypothetical protein